MRPRSNPAVSWLGSEHLSSQSHLLAFDLDKFLEKCVLCCLLMSGREHGVAIVWLLTRISHVALARSPGRGIEDAHIIVQDLKLEYVPHL